MWTPGAASRLGAGGGGLGDRALAAGPEGELLLRPGLAGAGARVRGRQGVSGGRLVSPQPLLR